MKITTFSMGKQIQLDDSMLLPGLYIPVQLQPEGPITTEDIGNLVRREGTIDNDVERTHWLEFRLRSDPGAERAVHRSVDMYLKTPMVFADGVAAAIG